MLNKEKFKLWMAEQKPMIIPEIDIGISISELKKAAVAIILIEKKVHKFNDYSIIFGMRSNKVSRHKGQVAFPGGSLENNETLQDAAIRETKEEIGLKIDLESSEWEILGQYPKHFITISDFLITPFIFLYKPSNGTSIEFHPDGYEMVEAFDVPIKHLLDPRYVKTEKREWQGHLFDMYYFTYHDKTIWGITGWLLYDFLMSLPLN